MAADLGKSPAWKADAFAHMPRIKPITMAHKLLICFRLR